MANRTIGENLRRIRRRLNLSQAQVGALIGISSQYYGQVELGKKKLKPARLKALCAALQVPLREVFDGVAADDVDAIPLAESLLDERLQEAIRCMSFEEKRMLLEISHVLKGQIRTGA